LKTAALGLTPEEVPIKKEKEESTTKEAEKKGEWEN
jgi:hypothetical protein